MPTEMSWFATNPPGDVGIRDIGEHPDKSEDSAQTPVHHGIKPSDTSTPLAEHRLPLIPVQGGEGIQRGQFHRHDLDGPPESGPESAEENLLTPGRDRPPCVDE
jgi:hypothetical protein